MPIIGTIPDMIDAAEDRERFQKLLHKLGLRRPPNRTARAEDEALRLAEEIGYPLVVLRPSYVLGGRAMEIVHEPRDLERYMREAVKVSHDSPVLLDRWANGTIECDVDALSDGQRVFIGGVMEHIEQAGVHSGDSACSLPLLALPSHRGRTEAPDRRHGQGTERDRPDERAVRHPAEQRRRHRVRAGSEPARLRTVPYVPKATGLSLAKIAARCMAAVAGLAGHRRRSGAAVRQRHGSGVPVQQVPGRGPGGGTRDALHR